MIDVAIAEFLAAFLKAIDDNDPAFRSRVEAYQSQLTVDEILEALKIVKKIRHDDLPSDRQLRESVNLFLNSYRKE